MEITADQKEEVIDLILNTWDFCGNVGRVVRNWELSNSIFLGENGSKPLFEEAEKRWNDSLEDR